MLDRMTVERAVQVINRPVFLTREIAAIRGTTVGAASQSLHRMERDGILTQAARGIWCVPTDPRFNRFLLVSYLSGSHRAYLSFFSALHLFGMIEQIPRLIYSATTGHSHIQRTPLATYSYHQIQAQFFAGFDWYTDHEGFLVASREKALIDCLYLSTRKGRRFGRFPELEFDRKFSITRARQWIRLIPDHRLRPIVSRKLEKLWN